MKFKAEHTPEDLQNILNLFYRTELREGEKVIDNRDKTIAKETGIHWQTVNRLIEEDLMKKRRELNNRISKEQC